MRMIFCAQGARGTTQGTRGTTQGTRSRSSPCACPSGHFLGYWPPWGGTRSREPRKPRKALKTLHPSQERVPRGAQMVPPYFQGAESLFGLNLLHFHGFRGAKGALRGRNLIRGTTVGRPAGKQDGQTTIFFIGLQARHQPRPLGASH